MHIRLGAWLAFVIIGITTVACSNGTPALPTPTAQASTQMPPSPTDAPNLTQALAIADSGETLLAEAAFTHNGFRTQVERQVEVIALPSGNNPTNLVVKLENLSASSGSLNTRATLNFDRGFDNYIEVPTEDGPLKLHLHRDGTLVLEADNGPFT